MHNTVSELRQIIETALADHLPQSTLPCAKRLNEALQYALFPGGKRLRPVLTLLGANVANGSLPSALPVACAIEFLHTTSLIFDDLPAMDDADRRRGNPALHLVFGEGVAQLAALALLNQTYALFGRSSDLIAEAATCLGPDGMIGGQSIDIEIRSSRCAPSPFLERNRKTSALMRLTLSAGAIACGAPASDVAALSFAGECLGEAYQVCDDLLDQYDREDTGKTPHQDARHFRSNYAMEFGSDSCHSHVSELIDQAKQRLTDHFGSTRPVGVMISHIDAIVREFGRAGLALSCS